MACITKNEYLDQLKNKFPGITKEELDILGKVFDTYNGNTESAINYLNSLSNKPKPFIMPEFIPYTPYKGEDVLTDPITKMINIGNEYSKNLIIAGIIPAGKYGKKLYSEYFHNWAEENVPLYKETADAISGAWESNELIQQLKYWIKPDSIGKQLLDNINTLNSAAHATKQDIEKLMDETALDLDRKLDLAYDKASIPVLDDILAKSGLFALANTEDLLELVRGNTDLKSLITKYETKVGHLKEVARKLSKLYMHESLEGEVGVRPNVSQYNITLLKNEVEILTSLYSLQKIDKSVEMLQNMFSKHNDLYNSLMHLVVANTTMNKQVYDKTKDINVSRGNNIDDLLTQNLDIVAITAEEWGGPLYNETNDWKVLRTPTKEGKYGIVYREATSLLQEGMGTNVSYIKTGVRISASQAANPKYYNNALNGFVIETNVGNTADNKVLALTKEEMNIIGAYNDPVKSLLRAYAHNYMILNTTAIRDTFIDGFTYNGENKTLAQINSELKEGIENNKHPVFIKLPADLKLDQLDPSIKNKYKNSNKSILSDVGDFKNKVDLVRKDLGFAVEGFTQGDLFKKHSYNVYLNKLTAFLKYLKSNNIILNGPKIALDMVASTTLVLSKGASVIEAFKYGTEGVRLTREMTNLRNERLLLKIEFDGEVDNNKKQELEKKLKEVEKKISEHEFSPALRHGFIQSLGTEVLSRERESLTGLQVEMDKIISKLTQTPTGEKTKLANNLMKFANWGVDGEAIFLHLGDLLRKFESTKAIGDILHRVNVELSSIKTRGDANAYISTLLAAPNSSFVRLGGALTLYADLIPRWILYKHNINSGMSEEDSARDALITLLDYKVQMPPAIKFLSDLFILPYPSFFLRAINIVANLAITNPISFIYNILIILATGATAESTVGAVYNKIFGDGRLVSSPLNLITLKNLIPYANLLGHGGL